MVRLIAFLALLPAVLLGYTTTTENGVTVYLTDGSRSDVQSAVTAASDGEIVNIPSGTYDWSSQVTVTGKGITIRGQGGGAILGFSYSTEEFTATEKTFIVTQPDPLVFIREPVVGERLGFHYPSTDVDDSLHGEVTAWDPGTRTITVDVDEVNGEGGTSTGTDKGDEFFWVVLRPAITTIRVASGSVANELISMDEDATHRGFIKDIGFDTLTSGVNFIEVWGGGDSAQPVTISGCTFSRRENGVSVDWHARRGLIYDCSWHTGFNRFSGSSSAQGLAIDSDRDEWVIPSRLGTLDPDGLQKLYVEDCIAFSHYDTLVDILEDGRLCWRNSIIHSSKFGGHSMDTGFGNGMREFEYYNNAFLYLNTGTGRALPSTVYVAPRGGTGVVHSSYVQSNESSSWNAGKNQFFRARVYETTRGGGEGNFPWSYGDGETTYPSVDYPIPHNVGVGYIDGSGGTFEGATGTRQRGEPVPVWIWNLSGTPGNSGVEGYGEFTSGSAYTQISSSEWSDSGGDLLLTESGSAEWLPTVNGARVLFDNGTGTLPTGLSEGTSFYAIEVDAGLKQWKFSATPGGAAIAYTDSGTSTNYLSAADSTSAHIQIDTNGDTVVEGDVVFHTTDVPLPGYEEYPYPHWLQQVTQAGAAYGGRLRFNGTGAKPVRTDGVGQPIIFDQ